MNDEIRSLLGTLRAAVAARDADAVEDAVGQLEFYIDDGWPPELFEGVKVLLLDPEFLSLPTSYKLIREIVANWNYLTAEQRAAFRQPLAAAYDQFGDWLGAMVVAEIFADFYTDDAALTALDDFSSRALTQPARAFAAYGLGRFARNVVAGPLYDRAVARLKDLASSPAAGVRQEAAMALQKLEKPS
jgi:hypothetical protein